MDSFFFLKNSLTGWKTRELTYNVITIDSISILLAYRFINSRLTRLILFIAIRSLSMNFSKFDALKRFD